MNKKIIWGVVVTVILVAIGMYFYLANRETNYVDSEAQLQLISETYSGDGFEFQYPNDWTLEEKDGIRLSQGQDMVVVRVYSDLRSDLRCEPHDWREEVDKAVVKEICIKGDSNMKVVLFAFSELGIKVADHIYSTMKFISVDPLVKVTSPNGGEILKIDQTYSISFKNTDTSNGGTIYISPKGKDMDKSLVVDRFAYKAQVYSWKAGEVYSSDFKSKVKIVPGEYKMGICITNDLNNSSTEECDWSDNYFTITSSTNAPSTSSIKIISPTDKNSFWIDTKDMSVSIPIKFFNYTKSKPTYSLISSSGSVFKGVETDICMVGCENDYALVKFGSKDNQLDPISRQYSIKVCDASNTVCDTSKKFGVGIMSIN